MSLRAPALPLLGLFAVVALGHLTLFPRIADLDGFYHIGHASAYLEGSPFDTSLPWATRSIIGDIGGDLWWGFHVLLLPFAWLGVAPGLRLAAVGLTLGLGLTVRWVLRREGVAGAGWWAALFLVAVPNVFYRNLMVRPHVISLGASIALLATLVRGRWWQVAALSAVTSWVHLSLFWLPPAIACAYAVARIPVTVGLGREQPDTGVPLRAALPAAFVGSALGWLLRPDALATASLLYVQLVQLFTLKSMDQPLTFASELSPLGPGTLLETSWFFALAWIVAVGSTVRFTLRGGLSRLGQRRGTLVVAAFLISTAFLGLTLVSARRAMEQWVAFGFLMFPLLASAYLPPAGEVAQALRAGTASIRTRVVAVLATALLVAHLGWGADRHAQNVDVVAFPANTLEAVAEHLSENSAEGEVVFHAHWDNFGPLFARNRTNRYLGGMDPIFQFAHDRASYWEFFYLSADVTTEWTCDAYPCETGNAADTHEVLTEHFDAHWVVVEPARNPRFSLYLLGDPRFELALEAPRAALFEIVRATPGPTSGDR